MMQYLKTFALHHLFYIILMAVGLVGYRSWLAEHDARLLSDQTVKVSEQKVRDLAEQIQTVQAMAAQQVQAVQRTVAAIKTPAQAIAAMPSLSSLPLNSRAAVDNPTQVSVDAVQLAQELGQCKVDRVQLGSCQATQALVGEQLKAKDAEVAALKRKPGFWKRVWGGAKKVGVGVAIGVALKAVVL